MKLEEVILRDDRASQPAANTVPAGTIYYVTDENVTERSTGAAWEDISDAGSAAIADGDKGDITVSASGATWTVDNDVVSDAKLRNSGALSVIGRSANSTGDPADISASAASGAVLRESGSTLGFGTVASAGIADAAITYAKIQDISAASKLLGRGSAGGSGDTEEISLGSGLSMSGTTLSATASGSAMWTEITSVGSGTGTEVTVTSSLNYNEIMVVLVGVTTGSSANIRLQVSTNSGVSYLNSSGDYQTVTNTGVESADTVLPFHSGVATGARTSWLKIQNFNGTTAVKLVECPISNGASNVLTARIPTTSALNAIRVFPSSGNFNSGGTIKVYGRG